jgi:hypothetical protein
MVSPILNEDIIVNLLSVKASVDTIPPLQHGALQALLDMYDRKVTRDVFIQNAVKCVALHTNMAKLHMLRNIQVLFEEGTLGAASFERANNELTTLVEEDARQVIACVKEMMKCADDGTPIQ